ncbi:nucleotidyltransferase domain-containing protein [Telmatobacter bradus]|uniref:nucleotidyltransferase domain-containing protein n=1 Tax=Telmatobacter bradus TaxID=474953 RepID=UPI003B431A48
MRLTMLTAEQVRSTLETLSPTEEKVDLAVRTAIEIARPSRVILFGSWPRGEARWDSDLDLAVLVEDEYEAEIPLRRRQLRRKLDEIPMSIDLVFTTESCAKSFLDSINSIYFKILREGKTVYERDVSNQSANSAA